MNKSYNYPHLENMLRGRPDAWAVMCGSEKYPEISGIVRFFDTPLGTMTVAEISGLPQGSGECDAPVFGFHIHEGNSCVSNTTDPFSNAGMHYNPHGCPHPYHKGDMPPLFGANGYALGAFLSTRFSVEEIIGKTVIIHSSFDDFKTQPGGNSGTKIACGVIVCRR